MSKIFSDSTVPITDKKSKKSTTEKNPPLKIPYKYTGALDLKKDKMVCISRDEDVNKIINGLIRSEYWSVLGAKQVGKTTLLRQIKSKYTQANCVYLNFELLPTTPDYFYQWLMEKLLEEIPSEPIDIHAPGRENFNPGYKFLQFLKKFQPKERDKKILLLFDEIEELPSIVSFLNIWRQTFQDRYNIPQLEKYAVVVTGSVDLISFTMGTNSPFNITEKHYIKDFTEVESDYLISVPFEKLGIEIHPKAKEKLISEISGHPQLLQHTCHILADTAIKQQRTLTTMDVDDAIQVLFKTNTNLETLKQDVINDNKLRKLVKGILKGETRKYHPHKEWAISGAGAIIEDENFCCAIRNKVYERFLKDFFEIYTPQFIFAEESNYLEMESTERYKLIQKVGEGGMGTVYKAKDLRLQRIVALKMIKETFISDETSLRRFLTEARTIARLSHPNIVTVFDVGKCEHGHFISMEFIEGMDLLKIILSQGQLLTLPQIFYITKKLLLVLGTLHRNKIIHRDIKPRNIMVNHEGDIKIVDFGIAKIKTHTEDGIVNYIAGSPIYMSPEQINGESVGPRSDIYSVGITLFHLITGKTPYEEPDIQTKHLYSPVPSIKDFRSEIPDEFAAMVKKCMAKNKENRYQDIREMLDQLKIIETQPVRESIIKKEIKKMLPIVDYSSGMFETSIIETVTPIPVEFSSIEP